MKGSALLFMLLAWGISSGLVVFCFSKLFGTDFDNRDR